jgi:hypothetical protein
MRKIIPPQLKKGKRIPITILQKLIAPNYNRCSKKNLLKTNKVKLWFHQIGFLKVFPAHNSLKM